MNDGIIHLLQILEVGLIASVKFLISPFEAQRQGFNFEESFLITTTGGIAGILIFSLVGEIIARGWKKLMNFLEKPLQAEDKPVKKFTWLKKFVIRTKLKFGLAGLVITTPVIISIPIGAFVIHRFYRDKKRNIFLLIFSLIVWSLILNSIAQYLNLSQYLPK